MDQATINAKVAFGLGKAAQYVGAPFELHRPGAPRDAIGGLWRIATLKAAFAADAKLTFTTAPLFGKLDYYGTFDTAQTQPGDFLVHPQQGIYYIAAQEPMTIPHLMRCNRVLTFTRPNGGGTGADYYGGDVTANETPLLTGWPAGLVQGTRGEAGPLKLPGDTRMPLMTIYVSAFPGVDLHAGDIATDDEPIPSRFTLSSVERTSLGYRLTGMLGAA